MKTFFAVVGFVVVALVVGTCVACNDDDDNSLGRIQLVNHERSQCYEDEGCYDERGGDRGDYSGDQDYDQWNSDQRNHNRRNRGAFSPGPFDDSPVDAFNNVCMPGATCNYDDRQRRDEPPPEERR